MSNTNLTVVGPRVPIKRKRVMCLYNVQHYSDIIIKFSNRRVFAHKAILAASSLYFHRAFTSGFAVASNPEIDLGDDDKPYQVEIMLRTMYDDDTVWGLDIDFDDPNLPRTFLDYYTPGDKYDVPVLRQKAKDMFFREIQGEVVLQSDHEIWRSDMFNNTAKVIAMVLGPSAITFADKSIQEETLEWCALYFNELLWHRYFRKMLGKGQIFSSEFAGRLFLKKARIDHVEFGIDIDNDVYDHSSADEHITQAESESESEAEEEDDDEEGDDEEEDDDGESNDGGSTQVRGYEPGEELGS